MSIDHVEEGDECPECNIGKMVYEDVENCSCFLSAPCNACVSVPLTCSECKWEYEDDTN